MTAFNPYFVDEIVTEPAAMNNYFGLILGTEAGGIELYGYEVTMSGGLVVPELHSQSEEECTSAD